MGSCVIDSIDVILTYFQNSFIGGSTLKKAFKTTQRVVDVIFLSILIVIIISGVICRLFPGEKADYTKTTNAYITEDKALVSAYTLEFVSRSLEKITSNLRSDYPNIKIIYAGGVMSNSIIKRNLSSKFDNIYFAMPEFSTDNASGTALLALSKYLK